MYLDCFNIKNNFLKIKKYYISIYKLLKKFDRQFKISRSKQEMRREIESRHDTTSPPQSREERAGD
jgi:hypothetical protein